MWKYAHSSLFILIVIIQAEMQILQEAQTHRQKLRIVFSYMMDDSCVLHWQNDTMLGGKRRI